MSDPRDVELIGDVTLRCEQDRWVSTGGVKSVGARLVKSHLVDGLGLVPCVSVEVDEIVTTEILVSVLLGVWVAHVDD